MIGPNWGELLYFRGSVFMFIAKSEIPSNQVHTKELKIRRLLGLRQGYCVDQIGLFDKRWHRRFRAHKKRCCCCKHISRARQRAVRIYHGGIGLAYW